MSNMSKKHIMLIVAHSSQARGAVNKQWLVDEYELSHRASVGAFYALSGSCQCTLYDVGAIDNAVEYMEKKLNAANRLRPDLIVEIHANSSEDSSVNYGEVIHHKSSVVGSAVAQVITNELRGLYTRLGVECQVKDPRPNSVEQDKHAFAMLNKTSAPCLIVEPFFISNNKQAGMARNIATDVGRAVGSAIGKWLIK